MNQLDNFLKTSLKDYKVTPSEAERRKFLKEVVSGTKKRGLNKKWIYPGLTGGAILITVLLTYLMLSIHPPTINKPVKNPVGLAVGKKPGNIHQINNLNSSESHNLPKGRSKAKYPVLSVAISKASSGISSSQIPGQINSSQTGTKVEGASLPLQTERKAIFASLDVSPILIHDPYIPVSYKDNIPETISKVNNTDSMPGDRVNNPETNPEPVIPVKKEKVLSSGKNLISAGVYYEPEMMFNLLKEDKHMMVNNFGLKGEYYLGPFSIGTGIGLSVTRGTNEIDYGYNQYLGTFKKLDSITFKWNQYHTRPIPDHYYYSDHAFYDSKVDPGSASINRQYIYLQIPLTLGYDFIRTSIIRIGIRIGPTLSVLIQTTPIQEDVSHGKDRIVQINDISWDRISTNYQFNGGIAAGIRLTRIFELEAEPVASYYFNSVYEKGESDKKPWSVGLRVSILIRNR